MLATVPWNAFYFFLIGGQRYVWYAGKMTFWKTKTQQLWFQVFQVTNLKSLNLELEEMYTISSYEPVKAGSSTHWLWSGER